MKGVAVATFTSRRLRRASCVSYLPKLIEAAFRGPFYESFGHLIASQWNPGQLMVFAVGPCERVGIEKGAG
jgi:hypothetical protein